MPFGSVSSPSSGTNSQTPDAFRKITRPTAGGAAFVFAFPCNAAGAHSKHSEFEDLAAEIDNDASLRLGVESARRWVADSFYAVPTLASLRLKAGLSQKELGERCNLQQEHISRYESGRIEPKIGVASTLAAALGVSLDEFTQAWNNARARVDAGNKESQER